MDAAESHYAAGNCRRQKKDFAAAEAEFDKALENHPQSADLIYDIGDYGVKHSQPERLVTVADAGEAVAAGGLGGKKFRGGARGFGKGRRGGGVRLLRANLTR